jgi:hypothetical protein
LEQFVQEREYVRRYGPAADASVSAAAISFVSDVRLFTDAAGADGYLEDELADIEGSVGKDIGGAISDKVERLKVGSIGDEAAGVRTTMTLAGGGPAYETQVFFRRGRLLVSVAAVRSDDVDFKSELETLARSLDERIKIVLEATPVANPPTAQ